MVWKLLIIKAFFQQKLNKIKTENCLGVLGACLALLESPSKSHIINLISQIFEVRCGRY
jgi:hypothetical protein